MQFKDGEKEGFSVQASTDLAKLGEFNDLSDEEIEGALSRFAGEDLQTPKPSTENNTEKKDPNMAPKGGYFDGYLEGKLKADFEDEKTPTSQRLKYQAEVAVIKKHLGDLEKVRSDLGLSRRKMAQLLMVDPSAWTRWTKADKAPPHIYRALQWYLALIEKQPSWHPQNSFNAGASVKVQEEKMGKMQEDLERQIAYLKKENNRLEEAVEDGFAQVKAQNPMIDLEKELSIGMGWKLLVLVNFVGIVLILLAKLGWL